MQFANFRTGMNLHFAGIQSYEQIIRYALIVVAQKCGSIKIVRRHISGSDLMSRENVRGETCCGAS